MKKLSATVLSSLIALSSMGAGVSALSVAEEGAVQGTAGAFGSNKATTEISLITSTTARGNISATVPLTVTLAVNADGSVIAPDAYVIKNNSEFDIKVTNVKASTASDFTFVDATEGTYNADKQMKISLAPTTGTAIDLFDFTAETGAAADWTLKANEDAADTNKLTFSGTVNNPGAIGSAVHAFDVSYTLDVQ